MLFTPQNSRENAQKAHESRRRNAIALKEAAARNSNLSQTATAIAAENLNSEDYIQARLALIRSQLAKIDKLFADEEDPAKLDRLASASAKLAEQERTLAGRPLPGSLRPNGPPKRPSIFDRKPASTSPSPAQPAEARPEEKFEQE